MQDAARTIVFQYVKVGSREIIRVADISTNLEGVASTVVSES